MKSFGLYINGQYVHTSDYDLKLGRDPFGTTIQTQFSMIKAANLDSKAFVEAALQGSQETFEQLRCGFFPIEERVSFLNKLIREIDKSSENLSRVLCGEIAKPLSLARIEVQRCQSTIEATIAAADELKALKKHENKIATAVAQRIPKGVALAITPFNFPLNLALHKIAVAILCGCPVILKPSDKALLSTLYLVDLCHAVGLPAGMLQYLHCDHEITLSLCADPRIAHVSFTGSAAVGWSLKAKTHGTLTLELGGNAPVYIDESADLDLAAKQCALGAFSFAGQVCISVQNIYAHPIIIEKFREKLQKEVQEFPYGDAFNENVLSSTLINVQSQKRVQSLLESQKKVGVKVIAQSINYMGLLQNKKQYFPPTLLESQTLEGPLFCEEIFAPIVTLTTARFEEWVDICNDQSFRLQCALFSTNEEQINTAFSKLDFGGIAHNLSPMIRVDDMPYGGQGKSGLGREGPLYAIEDYTTWKACIKALV